MTTRQSRRHRHTPLRQPPHHLRSLHISRQIHHNPIPRSGLQLHTDRRKRQLTDSMMPKPLGQSHMTSHIMIRPHLPKLRTGGTQLSNQLLPSRLPHMPAIAGPKRSHHHRQLLIGIDHRPTATGHRKNTPQRIPQPGRPSEPKRKKIPISTIPSKHVIPLITNESRRLDLIQDPPSARLKTALRLGPNHQPGHVRQPIQMLMLRLIQPQGLRNGIQYLGRGIDPPPLLQPGVPSHPDPGELRHLLAPQPRRTTPRTWWKPQFGRVETFPASAQEGAQLGSADLGRRGGVDGHAFILDPRPTPWPAFSALNQVALVIG